MAKTASLTFLGQKPLGIDSLVGKISEDQINGQPVYAMEVHEVYRQQKEEDKKQSLEFSRYKQDCRKRALELAHSKIPFIKEEGQWEPTAEQINELADKYYNWLINLPQ